MALVLTVKVRRHDWEVLPETFKGSLFLLSLVVCASMMPVESLPVASWRTTLGLGFLSAVFDNIPLTALAIKQGGYDWGMLAYAVGFGGSMVWFGSSAGVALSNMYPEAKSAVKWVRHGWPVIIGYVVGFGLILSIVGWHPEPLARDVPPPDASSGGSCGRAYPVRRNRLSSRRIRLPFFCDPSRGRAGAAQVRDAQPWQDPALQHHHHREEDEHTPGVAHVRSSLAACPEGSQRDGRFPAFAPGPVCRILPRHGRTGSRGSGTKETGAPGRWAAASSFSGS